MTDAKTVSSGGPTLLNGMFVRIDDGGLFFSITLFGRYGVTAACGSQYTNGIWLRR